jgi:hypothetical protein
MSTCAISGCPNRAVAHGLCAKHYMRQRRHGDPNVEIPVGRHPKPTPAAPKLDAVKRENAALREQVQALTRDRDEARAKGGAAMLLDRLAAIVKEREAKGLAMSKATAANSVPRSTPTAHATKRNANASASIPNLQRTPISEIDGG